MLNNIQSQMLKRGLKTTPTLVEQIKTKEQLSITDKVAYNIVNNNVARYGKVINKQAIAKVTDISKKSDYIKLDNGDNVPYFRLMKIKDRVLCVS